MKSYTNHNPKNPSSPHRRGYNSILKRRLVLNLGMILALTLSLFQGIIPFTPEPPPVSAHNLNTRMVSMIMDPATQAMLDARMAAPSWAPPTPLIQAGDELGLIIKVIPRDGTTTGVGGNIDFYVPDGVEVVDVGYMIPNTTGGFSKVPMKGQSPIAIGDGPIGAKTTAQLVGMSSTYTNINGVTETAVVPASGLHRGTIAGVYGDTGIFFSTDPDTAFGTWQAFTGDSTTNGCGSLVTNPTALGETLINNSGDTVVPCNKWDAEQLMAWGVKGGTYGITAPIVDYADGRGNAPWGFASSVAGPQSGYAWNFDWDEWQASSKDAAAMQNAMGGDEIGPWQRIQYPGSRVSYDQAGLVSTVLGYASIDAAHLGVDVSALPATESQTDTSSPKVIRWAVGQLTAFRPEYAWVKIRVNSIASITDPSGCTAFHGDTFGGDAGGTDNGKDHLWRYYEPTEVSWNECMAVQKPATREFVKVGDTYQYKINVYNMQNFTLTNVKVTDTLPSGVTFVSAIPVQNSGPNPLQWNIGSLLPGQKFSATVTVTAKSTGYLDNKVTVTSDQLTTTASETTLSGLYPYLVPSKTARSASVAPGGTVIYDILVKNIGTGPSGNPVTVTEYLPTGFKYDPSYAPVVKVNGALVTPTLNYTNLAQPVFTIPASILGGQQLTIAFQAKVDPSVLPGEYCNTFSAIQNGVPVTTGSEACLQVAGGKVGDTIWRDWDGDGMQDTGEEGIAGVTVNLYASDGTTLLATTTTDATGKYYFNGLMPGTYVVKANDGATLTGYTQTGDPDSTINNMTTVTLATDQQFLTADFGYQPTGTAVIGDKVFEDVGKDGSFTSGTDTGIANVTVWLYEDTNGDGLITAGTDALVATTSTNSTGDYSFTNLAGGFNYLVKVDKTDPDVQSYFNNKYDPDPVPFQLSTSEVIPSPNLSGSDLDNDFGFWMENPASIGDQVFLDANKNGTFDSGDSPLSDVTVTLWRDGAVAATATTGADGKYLFANLGPGSYSVVVDTADADLLDGLFATKKQFDVPLSAGQNYLIADFPFVAGMVKTVDKAYAVTGNTLLFTIKPYYPGYDLLTNVRIIDPLPTGTTYSSATAGGVFGAYTPIAAVPGSDDASGLTLATSFTVSTNQVTMGSPVTVTLKVTSSANVNEVTPSDLGITGGSATCSGPVPASANVPSGSSGVNFVWTCTPTQIGEYTFTASAIDSTGNYTWPDATSASVLSTAGGGPNVVTWNLGSTADDVHGQTMVSGTTRGVYALRGGGTLEYSKYDVLGSTWGSKAPTLTKIAKGGALTTDGSTTIYALRGDTTQYFDAYDIVTNTWSSKAITGTAVNEGGALVYLNAKVYALMGNSTVFKSYDTAGNTWTTLAPVPAAVKKGGALTTDGTNIYALQGDRKNLFYRYNVSTNTWIKLANTPANIGWGGSLTYIGGYIYALRGDGQKNFYRYDIASNTWTSMASTLGNVSDGGSLTNDGTYIYALQGKTKTFWRYNIPTNTWSVLPATNFTGNVGRGGALVYVPGIAPNGLYTNSEAGPSLVSTGDTIKVTFTAEANNPVTGVSAGTLTINSTGGASASCGSAALISADNTITAFSDPVVYQYTCTVTAGTNPGSLTFSTSNATGTSGGISITLPTCTSNSVLVSPALTYTATVNSGAPAVIKNTAILAETSGDVGSFPSNTTETATSGSIGDFVWADLNGNGLQDSGEPGIEGVKVYLDSNSNGVWDSGEPSDVTDSSGMYRIFGLSAGTYTVRADPSTYPAGYLPTTSLSLSVPLTAGLQYSQADFGLKPAGAGLIGDTVWLDANSNGLLDSGETGLPGVRVTLQKCIGGECYTVVTKTTDANGNYLFTGLTAGDYRVVVDSTSTVTSPYGGTATLSAAMSPTYDKDGVTTANTALATLETDSTVVTDADFGYNWKGSIGDSVWMDTNANGSQDGEETGIGGAVVLLYMDANKDGILDPFADNQVGFTRTCTLAQTQDPTNLICYNKPVGWYSFINLPPGNYLVDVYEDSITTDGVRDIVPTSRDVVSVNLTAGTSVTSADFGYYQGARVEGNVFQDANRNAVFDTGETGLAPVTVTLIGYDMFNNPVNVTTTTDASGHFMFLVPEGDYSVSYSTSQTTGMGYPDATTPTSYSFHASPGEDWQPTYDFGVDNSGGIGDRVWNDADHDGVQDAGEGGLANVTVDLYSGDGITWLGSTATDAYGNYTFAGLPNGNYLVQVITSTLPSGFVSTYDEDSGTTSPNNQTAVTILNSEYHQTADFGYYNAASYPISGNVFNDMNNLGVKDGGEPGLAGITVYLYDSTGTTLLTTAITDASGNYTFAGMPDGTYQVRTDLSTLPSPMYSETYEKDGSINNSIQVPVFGAAATGNDFGFHAYPGSISGSVCSQADGDGLCEAGEAMLPGVTVTLRYAGTDGIMGTADDATQTTTTDSSGNYSFTDLAPGLYQVLETNLPNFTSLADRDGGNPDNITLNLTLGENAIDQDFEDYGAAALTGRLWVDEDSNGLQDAGEAGIANVEVTATSGSQSYTTRTDSDGNYSFSNLPPGTYTFSVTPATLADGLESNPTADPDGIASANTFSVNLAGGSESTAGGFGYNWASTGDVNGNTGTGAIGDRIWVDANGNGLQDPGEPGLGGVTVKLYTDDNHDGIYDDLVATTTTDAAGNFIFDDLAANSYVIEVNDGTAPSGYTLTADPDLAGTACTTCDNRTSTPVLLAPGDVFLNADFGYMPQAATGATIGDKVWLDANGNGIQDGNETGIAGVTVALIRDLNANGVWDAGEPVIADQITGSTGSFSFTGVPVADGTGTDDYLVWVNDTNLVLGTLVPSFDSDGTSSKNISAVSDLTQAGNLTQGFGFMPFAQDPGVDAVIGDTIFLDRNNNGTADPGEGLEGVKVNLYAGDGTTLLTTTYTNENGTYVFGNLPVATYVVKVDQPTGLTNTFDPDGAAANQSTLTVTTGQVNLAQDFGYQGTNTVSGTIWNDANANGLMDGTESGWLGGVTVALYDQNGNVVAATLTDQDGNYSFARLPNGTFSVDVTDKNNVLNGTWHSLGTAGTNSNSQADLMQVTLSGSTVIDYADFGYYIQPASAGNYIFYDANGDGLQDANEPGIPGVPVTLTTTYPNGGVTVNRVLTDALGHYSFGNLLLDEDFDGVGTAGSGGTEPAYVISVGTPSNYLASPSNVGTDSLIDSNSPLGTVVQPAMGASDPTIDFGFYQADWSDAPATYDGINPPENILQPDLNGDGKPDSLGATPAIWLGTWADGEPASYPTASANGDNLDNTDDEDGINIVGGTNWFEGTDGGRISVTLSSSSTASTDGYLMVWFDWNNDTNFDASEAAVSQPISWSGGSATQTIQFNIPTGIHALEHDLIYRARLFTTVPADPATAYQGRAVNGETEDYFASISTLPVTMNYFYASRKGNTLTIEWSTGTETGNIGFNLYAVTEQGFDKINNALIPSTGFTTQDPQDYSASFKNASGKAFYLEDVDILGRVTLHGPFELGKKNGGRVAGELTDWQSIRAENDQLQAKMNDQNNQKVNSAMEDRLDDAVKLNGKSLKQSDGAASADKVKPTKRVNSTPTRTPSFTATATPAPTHTPTPTIVPTGTPLPTATPAPTDMPTETPMPTDTPEPTLEPTFTPTETEDPAVSDTPMPVETDTPEPLPTETLEPTPTDTLEPTATDTLEPTPTDTPEAAPTATLEPSATYTAEPTATATLEPSPTPTQTQTPTLPPPVSGMRVVDLLVNQTGIYRITYEDLLAAGLDLAGQPAADVALTLKGAAVPVSVSGSETFGPGSAVEFFGQAIDSLYTTVNVYTLWVDRAQALRVEEDATAPDPAGQTAPFYMETAKVDLNKAYDKLSSTGDPWYNTRMVVLTTAKTWNYAVSVDHYLPGAAVASLGVNVYGGTNFPSSPDHHVVFSFNGAQLASRTFDALDTEVVQADLPQGNLKEGSNNMAILLPADVGQTADVVYLDRYSVTYPRAFWAVNGRLKFEGAGAVFQVDNLNDPSVVVYRLQDGVLTRLTSVAMTPNGSAYSARFSGGEQKAVYYVSGTNALLKPGIRAVRPQVDIKGGSAEYLIVSHPNFIPGLAPLVQARTAQGLDVRIVNVLDIYDQFSFGVFDAAAIKDYIAYAAENLGTQYVLLVGDDTYDYLGYGNTGSISFIPSIYMAVGDLVQYAPVDPKYADIDNDDVPDIPIGRFAVRTTTELDNVISKTLAYEEKDYSRTSVFAADWSYKDESDRLLAKVPSGWVNTKAYLDNIGVTQAHNLLIEKINAGTALTSYVGHSDDWQWTWDKLFTINDAPGLTNIGRPTLLTQNGCYNIYYVNPRYETMGDAMMNNGLQGAAAMFGSTTLTSDLNEQKLGDFFMPLLTRPGMTIGQAMLDSKQALAASDPNALDVLLGWSLLGDPYLKVTK